MIGTHGERDSGKSVSATLHDYDDIYIYIYIYMCVCYDRLLRVNK